jgi:NAD(P)-dependent dehydrogenase (short-subunit alcohol dehydrogenase family)
MKNKIVLITGVTSGIGYETALGLAKLNATIVFTTRDKDRGVQTRDKLITASNNKNIQVLFCDLASIKSIKDFCTEFKNKFDHLDVLINNAAIWDFKRRESKDGIENIFATNYLAPFLLTNLLLDMLKKSPPSRIINITSGLHKGPINFNDIESKEKFKGIKAYSQSKLALILFTRLLAKKLEGTGVTVNTVHPGLNRTRLGRDTSAFSKAIFKLITKHPRYGASRTIYLATSPDLSNVTGEYFTDKKIEQTSPETYDMDTAQKLWDLAVKYTNLKSN